MSTLNAATRRLSSLVCCLLLVTASLPAQQISKGAAYGAAMPHGKPVGLAAAIAATSFNAPIHLTATVQEVCQKKGCWMILNDGTSSVRVTFKDYAFFVPKNLAGSVVHVYGVLTQTVLSEADARHYAEDGGDSKDEIAKIKGEQRELGFEASAVRVIK